MRINSDKVITDLHRNYYGNLQVFFYKNIRNQAIVKDLAQEVFLRICRYKHKLPANPEKHLPYIYGIARNVLMDHFKSKKRLRYISYGEEILPNIEDKNDTTNKVEFEQNIVKAFAILIKGLTKRQAKVFLLKYQKRLSIEEIAQQLHIKEGTIKKRLCDSRNQLQKIFGAEHWAEIYQALKFRKNKKAKPSN